VDGTETVSKRIDLDPKLESCTIEGDVLHELYRHALEVAPEECCGLVIGTEENRFIRAVRVTNVMTKMHIADAKAFPRDARHAYYMSEVEYQQAIEEAESRGEHVSAIYHSHFGQGCYLSEDDLAFASHPLFPFPDAAQLVLSLIGDPVGGRVREVGIFEPTGASEPRFVGRRLEAAPRPVVSC
jgi:proteasome lid subunit RPN8/RPN11